MNLPKEIRVSYATKGMSFEFVVRDAPQGFLRLFPVQVDADEFLQSPGLRLAVAQEAVSALDAAVVQFLRAFESVSFRYLSESLDGQKNAGNVNLNHDGKVA